VIPWRAKRKKGRVFRELHERKQVFINANPWDIGTARADGSGARQASKARGLE
jgi:hypothetical protein